MQRRLVQILLVFSYWCYTYVKIERKDGKIKWKISSSVIFDTFLKLLQKLLRYVTKRIWNLLLSKYSTQMYDNVDRQLLVIRKSDLFENFSSETEVNH